MTTEKTPLTTKIKAHIAKNKDYYTILSIYTAGIAVAVISNHASRKDAVNRLNDSWDNAEARAQSEFGDNAKVTVDRAGHYQVFVPTPTE